MAGGIMETKKVRVVGCGRMGFGNAQLCAQSGYQVVVSEINYIVLTKIQSFASLTKQLHC